MNQFTPISNVLIGLLILGLVCLALFILKYAYKSLIRKSQTETLTSQKTQNALQTIILHEARVKQRLLVAEYESENSHAENQIAVDQAKIEHHINGISEN